MLACADPEQPVVAHLDEALRQDMLEEAGDECLHRQRAGLRLMRRPILIAKRDLAVLHAEEAIVRERHPKDVGRQVLQGGATTPNWTAIDDPVLAPGLCRDTGPHVRLAQRG